MVAQSMRAVLAVASFNELDIDGDGVMNMKYPIAVFARVRA